MAYVDVNTPIIDRITLPSGNTYYIADREIRDVVDALSQAIAGGVAYIIAWDGTAAPVVANIPAGVKITYNGTEYTGTLAANNAQPGAFYLIKSATQAGSTLDKYDEYVPVGATGSKTWEKIGDTQIDLSNVVTGVSLTKQTDTVIGTDATFTITQPAISLASGSATSPTPEPGTVRVVSGISSVSASGDEVTALTGLGSPTTKSAIGANSTFTVTQPTIAIATDTSSGTGKVQVATGISSVSASGDNVTAVTDLGTPSTDTFLKGVKVTTQPSVTLTVNNSTATGRITYVQAQGSATTTKLSASASGGAVSASGDSVTAITGLGTPSTQSAVKSVSPTTKKLAVTTVTGVSGSTTPNVVKSRSSQTTATGASTSSTTNTDWLKGVSVSNGVLTFGAATLNTQTTYSAGEPSSITIPTAASSATTVATGSTTTTGTGADIVTDVSVGDTFNAVTGYASPTTDTVLGTASTFSVTDPTITIATGTTGDVTVATGIGAATTKYLSASASGTAVGADGTGTAITELGTPTTDTVLGTGSTISVTPSTTYIKATASGAGVAWNSKDAVSAVTGYASPTTDTVIGSGSTITVTPTKVDISASASGANTAWNNKDSVTVLKSTTDVSVTKGT